MNNLEYSFNIENVKIDSFSTDTWKIVFTYSDGITIVCDDEVFELYKNNGFVIPANSIYKILGDDSAFGVFEFSLNTDYPLPSAAKGVELSEFDILLFNNLSGFDLNIDSQRLNAQKTLELLFLNITLSNNFIVPSESNSASLFKEAIKILKNNIDSSISVDELANKLGISLSNIKRLFAKYSDYGVHDYFNLLKINRAKSLLKDGYSVTETAALTGFANQAYFSAAFKRITGVSAKEFLTVRTRAASPKKEERKSDLPSYLL